VTEAPADVPAGVAAAARAAAEKAIACLEGAGIFGCEGAARPACLPSFLSADPHS
jgi:hypothetical protein